MGGIKVTIERSGVGGADPAQHGESSSAPRMTEMASQGNLKSQDSRKGSKYLQGDTTKDGGPDGAQDSPMQVDFGIISPAALVEQASHGAHINNINIQKPLGASAGVDTLKQETSGAGDLSAGGQANLSPAVANK